MAQPSLDAPADSATTDGRPSVAVLPCLDLAPARDHEYVCDGWAEELTNRLAHLRGLRVVARTCYVSPRGKLAHA